MSTGPRLPLSTAARLADAIAAALAPACERVAVAGGVRRQRPTVGDLDLVVVKRRSVDLLGQPDGSPADDLLTRWVADGRATARAGCKPGWRHATFSPFKFPEVRVELYAAEPDAWGLYLAARTGPAPQLRTPVTHVLPPASCPPA